jgi:hypothetical protein
VAPISRDEERLRLATREDPDVAAMLPVLDELVAALDGAGVDYLFMGGIASSLVGRERWTHDLDLFLRPAEARRALAVLEAAGFETEETFPDWLYKATKDGQLVDLIFRSAGDIEVDDEMLARAPISSFLGRPIRHVPPEDLVVIKGIVAAEHMPRHWHDALAVLAAAEIDWEYLMRRARRGIRRVLSLLLYAQSCDLPVPSWVVRELFGRLEGG